MTQAGRDRTWFFASGVASFVALHLLLVVLWDRIRASTGVRQAWFLNSGRAVLVTVVGLAIVAIAEGAFLKPGPGRWVLNGLAMAAGVGTAMCGVLAVIGPGNLFPLVIVFGLALTAPTVLGGVAMGAGLRVLATSFKRPLV